MLIAKDAGRGVNACMVAAMYLRKSRAEEAEPVHETLSRHRDALTRYAEANGIVIGRSYDEVASGDSLHSRPKMLQMLDELDRFDAVLCMDIDRLGRGAMRDQGIIFDAIRAAGAKIITPDRIYDPANDMDDSLISFKALFAREEYKMIRGRLRNGLIKSVEEGCYPSNAPFGYVQARKGRKPTLAVHEAEAQAVRLMFEMYRDGHGCQAIANRLHALGYRPRRGEKFNRTSVAKIIRNPVYIGRVVWNRHRHEKPRAPGQKHTRVARPREEWLVSDGLHDAIVPEQLFEEANRMLTQRYHPPYRRPDALENPFAGVLFCRSCGRAMIRQPPNGRRGGQPVILCATAGCCMSSAQRRVEQLFYLGIRHALEALEPAEPEARDTGQDCALRERAMGEIARLRGQLGRLHDLLEQGVYDTDIFLARRAELSGRIEAAAQASSAGPPSPAAAVARLRSVLEHYPDATPYEQNRMIKSVVARAVYDKPKGSGRGSSPAIEIVEWRA